MRRESNDRRLVRSLIGAQFSGGLPAVHPGEAHVHQDEVECAGERHVHGLCAIGGHHDIIAFAR